MNALAYLRGLGMKWFRKSALADEMEQELRAHMELRAEDLVRAGMTHADAARQARVELGAQAKFKEESYEAIGGNSLETLIRAGSLRAVAGVGAASGLLLGLRASRVMAAIVYQATPRDPLVLAAVVLAMALVGLLATWIPAQRP